ncbi:F-box only protein 34 isoform X2 [Dasypus novemcinctus]|nr:F-box only protein 34 isoform X2 [Dasypus novemcinctus]
MHLKPYWKLQKKGRPLETSKETLRTSMSYHKGIKDEKCKANYMKPSVFSSPSLSKASSRKPFGIISPNVLCSMSGKSPIESSLSVKTKKNAPPATIHQGEEGEGPLDIWAVVKPGNTKEKIAFFAAHQCSNRIGSMKIKSSWDIDGRATKRRKKSGDLKKANIQLERMKEVNSRCYQPEPFACGIEHCSVHYVSDNGDAVYAGRPLSVIQMVAFLEQRASTLLASCAKSCTNSPAVRFSGQSRGMSPASELFSAPGTCEEPTERGNPEVGEPQSEPVRVLDMVARLESECLKQQSQREPGSLSRNNSFRRNVGRVLLANGTQADEGKTKKGALEAPDTQVNPVGSVSVDCSSSRADHSSPKGDQAWDSASQDCPSLPAGMNFHADSAELEPGQQIAMKNSNRYDVEMTDGLIVLPFSLRTCPQDTELPTNADDYKSRELVLLTSQNPDQRRKESLCISITVSKVDRDPPSSLNPCEDPLPGLLFFLPPGQCQLDCSQLNESTIKESSEDSQLEDAAEGESTSEEKSVSAEPFVLPQSSVESTLSVHEASSWKKQVSHDFLETRFKIQQLLEPQQYMAFLPHHIMVKIFRLLPTKSLVALKCTCCYFKFIIEYYNIRPADSRWVRDPRYREDPCKQCKKKYVKGDVSLCRWHPKPYCQALPYGPGYWMCCHRSQKGFPGCKLGLHDNHWVPACHSFNRAMHKKAKGTETEEEY